MSSTKLHHLKRIYGSLTRLPFTQFAINSSIVLSVGFVIAMTLSGGG